MRRLVTIALLLLAACGPSGPAPTAAERRMAMDSANLRVRLSMDPCTDWREHAIHSHPYRDCVTLLPQERMRGVWYTGLEESGFIRNATTAPATRVFPGSGDPPEFKIFLEIDADAAERRFDLSTGPPGSRAIAIEFIGRRSRDAGTYLIGPGEHVIVVDRLISARLLHRIEDFIDCRVYRQPGSGVPCAPGTEGGRRTTWDQADEG